MKRHFLLLCLLVSVMTAWADNYKVAANYTPLSELTSGYYVIRVFGDKANANGNYLYSNGERAQHDAASVATSYEGTDELTDANYVWKVYVGETNGQKTIQLYNVGANKFIRKNAQENYTTNNNMLGDAIATYNTLENANSPQGFRLKSGNVFVVDDGSTTDGYLGNWAVEETAANCAQFKVYKVGIDVTYNFVLDGKTYTKKVTALGTETPKAAYEAFYTFPGYVTTTATWPSGTVSEENNTFTIACSKNSDYPVETNKWYFMKIGLFGEGNSRNGYIFDTSSQIATNTQTVGLLNNSFAWKFEGNPFDGYTIVNATGRRLVTSVMSNSNSSNYPTIVDINTDTKAYCDKWDVQGTSMVASGSQSAYWGAHAFVLSAKDHPTYILHAYNNSKVGYWVSTGVDVGSAIVLSNTLPAISLNASNGKHYATYYLPFAAKAPEGVKAYAGTVNNGSVKLTEYANGVIPANKGVLLVSDNATSATFTLANDADVTAIDNDLKGVTAATELTGVDNSERVRIFSTKDGVAGFYKPNSNITSLAANKAYVMAPITEGALALNFGGNVTGINSISDNAAMPNNVEIYDLAGRRVNHAVKGVYVVNGKKIIVK